MLPLIGLAIAFDNADGTHTGGSSTSFSYTVTGANPFFSATVGIDDSGSVLVSTSTYNSVTLTNANENGTGAAGSHKKSAIWYLPAPATGANTYSLTYTGTPSNVAISGAISLSGVAQSSPVDTGAASSAPASSGTHSLTASAANANEWQVSVIAFDTATLTASTNQNTRWTNTSNGFTHCGGGAAALAGSGSQTVTWTTNLSNNFAMSMIFVIAAVNIFQDAWARVPEYPVEHLSKIDVIDY